MTAISDDASGRVSVLDIVVLCAMAVTAFAFAAGLIVNTGVDPMAAGIAAAALFLVMASSHYALTRTSRPAADSGRLDEIEEALIVLDGDLQRIDQVEDDVARLDRAVSDGTGAAGGGEAEGGEHLARLSTDLERLNQQVEILRTEFESESRSQRDQIGAELRSLEVAIKDLSREVIASPAFAAAAAAEASEQAPEIPLRFADTETLDLVEDEAADLTPDEADEIVALLVEETTLDLGAEEEELDLAEVETVLAANPGSLTERLAEAFAVDEEAAPVKQAIEAGRVDLYVAPVVSLPGRKLRYYDATARVRDETDDVLPADESLAAAGHEGLLPRIDNVMLVKSVQLLRRLGAEETLSGVFCPLSVQSLSDADFFPELVEFLEENSTLGGSLIFQLDQSAIGDLGRDELGSLKSLGRLGFSFALDGVTSLDVDYAALRDHFFRFVKIDTDRLLNGGASAPVAAGEMVDYLDRFDLKLVAGNVESEHGLSRLMDIGVELAEGALFATPTPANAALFRELEETGTAFA